MTSSRIVAPGQYRVVVNTDAVPQKTPFTITTGLKEYKCKDEEPNEKEESTQKIAVNAGKKAVTYPMLLSGETFEQDLIDQLQFKLNKAQKIRMTATAKGTDRIHIFMVWLEDTQKIQVPYTIKVESVK